MTLVSPVQSLNACSPIYVTLSGIVTLFSPVQYSNALLPMFVTLSGIVTLVSKSVVDDPVFDRVNTRDNTPAVIHTKIVSGSKIRITAGGKGFGSENMSAIKMLTPSYGAEGVKRFILDTVCAAGPNPCPPIVVGVGIGGTFERAAQLAKKATFRPIDTHHPDSRYADMEDELLCEINKMGFGPAGLGGNTTALGVNIETAPTHIAGMPVAVNICCHAARHASAEI